MKLKKFKEKDNKRIGIIVFTIVCILLVSGVILYRTFAIFEVRTNQNVIKGNVQDPGNLYFAFYVDDEIQKEMPQKNGEYIFDEENSYCGVTGGNEHDNNIKLEFDKDRWSITVVGLKTSRTKCNLKFASGAYILDKPIKAVTSGDGLYKVTHGDEVSGTLNDTGFKQTEWRYAGTNPNNYITFNDETWRIIGLVNVMTDDNHKVEQRVKIIKSEPLDKLYSWDYKEKGVGSSLSNASSDWTDSRLMELLNNGYYNSLPDISCYVGNDDTLSTSSAKSVCDFTQEGLKREAQDMIDNAISWNLGGMETNNDLTADMFYKSERGTATYTNDSLPWSRTLEWKKENTRTPGQPKDQTSPNLFHGIGLIYPSDYGYATNGGTLGRDGCLKKELYRWDQTEYKTQCAQTDWLRPESGTMWLLSSTSNSPREVFFLHSNGWIIDNGAIYTYKVYPTLYLKTNVKILNDNQDGSEKNPFNLTLDTTE